MKPQAKTMECDVVLHLVLVDPPPGVDFGIQRGSGTHYETLFTQRSQGRDISFEFSVIVADDRKDGLPNFKGPWVQGPPATSFIYIDVGEMAGQKGSQWSRRMKVPLHEITWTLIRKIASKAGRGLLAEIPGKSKDGGPNCATVKDVTWRLA